MTQKFEKKGEKHAIAEFSASIRFFQPLDPTAHAEVIGELAQLARSNNLPAPINTRSFTFDLASGIAGPTQNTISTGWQRFAANGEPELSIACDPSTITFTTRRYTAWEEILPAMTSFFLPISKRYVNSVPAISAFQLSYLNEFRYLQETEETVRSLFRNESKWLPNGFSNLHDAWHSHIGAFEDIKDISRRLVNINVDCKTARIEDRPNPASLINLFILVSKNYDIPAQPPLVVHESELPKIISENFEELHTREKAILSEVLDDVYLADIGALKEEP